MTNGESLAGKKILLGVTGSIAAYKSAELCSRLGRLGAELHVVLTKAASKFVGQATFRALTRNPVFTDLFEEPYAQRIAHIDIAQAADLALIAPATADILARMAHGIADDMLTACMLATPSTTPILVAPAMNTIMWEHPATKNNIEILRQRGVQIIEPDTGLLACLDVGIGKLADIEVIVNAVVQRLGADFDYKGITAIVTAGPTREALDPVRYLSNRSSGKMGYAIAERLQARGAHVILVSGPVAFAAPKGVERYMVERASQMLDISAARFQECDLYIAAAAVADYAPVQYFEQKIKKNDSEIMLKLKRTTDILQVLGDRKRKDQILVGFAAETEELIAHAKAKLLSKNLDMIVANDVTEAGAGFEVDTNKVTILWADGRSESLPILSKIDVADIILDAVRRQMLSKID